MNIQTKVSKGLRKKTLGATNEYIEGTMSVIPNAEYRAKAIYAVNGIGELFSGSYYTKKVRHIINNGYSVECDVIKLEEDSSIVAPDPAKVDIVTLPDPKPEEGNYTIVVVKSGDTLSKIASSNRTTVSELTRLNKLVNPNIINIGQQIKVPKS